MVKRIDVLIMRYHDSPGESAFLGDVLIDVISWQTDVISARHAKIKMASILPSTGDKVARLPAQPRIFDQFFV